MWQIILLLLRAKLWHHLDMSRLSHLTSPLPANPISSVIKRHQVMTMTHHMDTTITGFLDLVFTWSIQKLTLNCCPFFRPWLMSVYSLHSSQGLKSCHIPLCTLLQWLTFKPKSFLLLTKVSQDQDFWKRPHFNSSFPPRLYHSRHVNLHSSGSQNRCLAQIFRTCSLCPKWSVSGWLTYSHLTNIYPMWPFFSYQKVSPPDRHPFYFPSLFFVFSTTHSLAYVIYYCLLYCYFSRECKLHESNDHSLFYPAETSAAGAVTCPFNKYLQNEWINNNNTFWRNNSHKAFIY